MDACPRWPLASWQLRVTSALSHPDSASTWNAGLWPSPLKRTRHLKASKSHDWCFTQLCSSHPCLARKQGIARAMSEGPSPRANSVLERWLRRVFPFCFPWPGQMPVLKLEGKHIIKICLPPSQIYLFPFDKQWFHFSSRPEFFFLSLLNWAQANVAKGSLLMSLFVKHATTTPSPPFWEQALAFPGCSRRGTSQHNSPQAQTHSFKNKYCLFFPFFFFSLKKIMYSS